MTTQEELREIERRCAEYRAAFNVADYIRRHDRLRAVHLVYEWERCINVQVPRGYVPITRLEVDDEYSFIGTRAGALKHIEGYELWNDVCIGDRDVTVSATTETLYVRVVVDAGEETHTYYARDAHEAWSLAEVDADDLEKFTYPSWDDEDE